MRAAVTAANERWRVRRSDAAKRAAETRRHRREKTVYDIVRRIRAGHLRNSHCRICSRVLSDSESIARGLGSECWQDVMAKLSLSLKL